LFQTFEFRQKNITSNNTYFDMIGKRKRDTFVVSKSKKDKKDQAREESPTATESSAQDIFRKFFEAQFEPLEAQKNGATQDESDYGSSRDSEGLEDSGSESEWSGLDGEEEDDDENRPVEVVDYTAPSIKADALMDKRARKAFMVSLWREALQSSTLTS
jgi:hypothetical protein